jgi:uncharacterized Zn finger protein (UPF0148 family)
MSREPALTYRCPNGHNKDPWFRVNDGRVFCVLCQILWPGLSPVECVPRDEPQMAASEADDTPRGAQMSPAFDVGGES